MKRLLAVLLWAAIALVMFAVSASAAVAYSYKWVPVTWGSDSSYCYIGSGASIGVKNSQMISLPGNTYWVTPADSLPQFIAVGTISAVGAPGDSLYLDYQWTYDGINFIPALDWDLDAVVHVGIGLYFSFRYLAASGANPVYTAAGVGDWAAGAPNTYRFTIPAKGAVGMRIVIHPSHLERTLNAKLRMKIGIPVLVQL